MKGSEGIDMWLCLGLSRSFQSYNKTHNRYRRLTPLRFSQLSPAGFYTAHLRCTHTVSMLIYAHKLEVSTGGIFEHLCIHRPHTFMCVSHSSFDPGVSEFLSWTQGPKAFSELTTRVLCSLRHKLT